MQHRSFCLIALLLAFGGCSSAVKTEHRANTSVAKPTPMPAPSAKSGPLKIDVVYPAEGLKRPSFDSNFIFGSIGTGEATLTIDSIPVPLAKNGAFLAFLKIPSNGEYTLIARESNSQMNAADTLRIHYAPTPTQHIASPQHSNDLEVFRTPRSAIIIKGSDTLATGSDAIPASQEPSGDRKWQWTKSVKLMLTGKRGTEYSVQLMRDLFAWIPDTSVRIDTLAGNAVGSIPTGSILSAPIGTCSIRPDSQFVDVRLRAHFAPYYIDAERNTIELILYNRTFPNDRIFHGSDPLIKEIHGSDTLNAAHIVIRLTKPLWGYKAFYDKDGYFTLRVRRGPVLDLTEPLRGLTIMLDPGHPPGGAIGPTRLTEEEANLAIALRVREKLLARGANVVMTRTTSKPLVSAVNQSEEVWARADSAVHSNADLLVSIHNNAFPEGTDPFLNNGTSTYYFNPFSSDLAETLDRRIAEVTGIENLGGRKRSLAMVRPTWMPCALTESLYMMFPEQESALRNSTFLDRLAEAHVKGIEDFLRGRMVGP